MLHPSAALKDYMLSWQHLFVNSPWQQSSLCAGERCNSIGEGSRESDKSAHERSESEIRNKKRHTYLRFGGAGLCAIHCV